jgi:NADH dehydrogenase
VTKNSKVVIVGGGFAGLSAYRELRNKGYAVTLVDRHPYTAFQPLLYQVAIGGLNAGDVTYSLRRIVSRSPLSRAAFRRATVTGIDQENKRVEVSRGKPLAYDALILAQGVGPNFFGIPGAEEHSERIYTRAEALRVRDVIFSRLEELSAERDPDRRFTVLVVGGGATGVEMAGSLAELKSEALPTIYPELSTDDFRVVLVEMAPHLLAPFEERLRTYALRQLKRRGVDVRLNTAVTGISGDCATFADDTTLDVDVVIWATGVQAAKQVGDWGVPQGKAGRIVVDERLQVPGFDQVYAAGDAAINPDNPLPQLAPVAQQMGAHAARQIIARDEGRPPAPFRYVDKGTMATIGRNAAVVSLPNGMNFTGMPAWVLWVVVHLSTLLGGRNRLQAMVNMAFRYFAWPRSAAGIIGDVMPPSQLERSRGPVAERESTPDPA